MSTPTVTETIRTLEPTTRDEFGDSPAAPATIRRPAAHRFTPETSGPPAP